MGPGCDTRVMSSVEPARHALYSRLEEVLGVENARDADDTSAETSER